MKEGEFHFDRIIHSSFSNIFKGESFIFDPISLPGEVGSNNKIRKKYITLTRGNLVEYLKKLKQTKTLSLNDFAKELYITSITKEIKHDKELKIIADLSSKVNMFGNNEWSRLDLSGLDFTNADITGSRLKKSDFSGAILSWSKCSGAILSDIKMDYLQANNSVWKLVKLERVSLNNCDLTATDFRGAKFLKIQASSSLFNDSLLNNMHLDDYIFDKSIFDRVIAIHTIWDNCIANQIEARRSNFTGSKFAEGSRFEKSDFSYSIFDGVKAPRGHFAGAVLNHIKAGCTKFADSCFENASFKFADLNS